MKVIEKLSYPVFMKDVRSFLRDARFYRCYIIDFSNISSQMYKMLEKKAMFDFGDKCPKAFKIQRKIDRSSHFDRPILGIIIRVGV